MGKHAIFERNTSILLVTNRKLHMRFRLASRLIDWAWFNVCTNTIYTVYQKKQAKLFLL